MILSVIYALKVYKYSDQFHEQSTERRSRVDKSPSEILTQLRKLFAMSDSSLLQRSATVIVSLSRIFRS